MVFSCSKDDGYSPINEVEEEIEEVEEIQSSPVNFDIDNIPYNTLSEYNFYNGTMADLEPVYGVLPYDLNSSLFSDYAEKKRFIWMPENVKANYVADSEPFDFPAGTILIKNFYYNNVLPEMETVIIETRLMIKLEDDWTFANYVWNEDQTEAFFTTEASFKPLEWIQDGELKQVEYRVPRFAECFTCHNSYDIPLPIGLKPQNLNRQLVYNDGIMNQLSKWKEFGYLSENTPSDIVSIVPYTDETKPLELRVRSYLDINCAHCHSDERHCDYAPIRFAFKDTDNPTSLGVCVENDFILEGDINHIFEPGNPAGSAAFARIQSTAEDIRMPILARTLMHEEGVALIETWINSLTQNCD